MQNVSPAQAPSILMMVGNKPSRKLRTEQAPASGAQIPAIVVEGSKAGSAIGAVSTFCTGAASTGAASTGVVSTINSGRSARVSSTISDHPTETDGPINFGCANSRL